MIQAARHHRARLIFDPVELAYDFGVNHTFQLRHLAALFDLLEESGLWRKRNAHTSLALRAATREELLLNHTPEYLDAVERLSHVDASIDSKDAFEERLRLAQAHGFEEGDTPVMANMHEITANIVGGTLVALSAVMGLPQGGCFRSEKERPLHVYHPAGGLHQGRADRAAGLCIYNDVSVAIAHVIHATEAKVLFLDFDAHHGGGVQHSFYDDPRVMTISFHETGRSLFPGTGDVLELGRGLGRGYSVNMPLEPYTDDDSYIEILKTVLPPLLASFSPDVIVSVHGSDTHAWDPFAHLLLTTRSMQFQAALTHQLAHDWCHGRWVALGGGGYDLYGVVPRTGSIVWAEMSGQTLPERLPDKWLTRWRPEWEALQEERNAALWVLGKLGKADKPITFPTKFLDGLEAVPARPNREGIQRINRQNAALIRHLLLSPTVHHVFPATFRPSPLMDIFNQRRARGRVELSRSKTIETDVGQVLFRNFCPPSLLKRLKAEKGLNAFARVAEREHQLLLGIAKSQDCALTVAHTPDGQIIGQVTLAPADVWWEGINHAYEIAIEVSSNWRGKGIASKLLAFALEQDAVEQMILIGMGLSWHWDIEGMGMSIYGYREMIKRLLGSQGFVEYPTNEPNISMEVGNILLARIGKRVETERVNQFLARSLSDLLAIAATEK